MTMPLPAAADLATAVETWLSRLADERRRSENTIAAYRRDIRDLLSFWRSIGARCPTSRRSARSAFATCAPGSRTGRRRVAPKTSTARALSRRSGSSFGILERDGVAVSSALSLVRAPKTPRGVPRPAQRGPGQGGHRARRTQRREPPDWVARRDTAVLLLLYGCGLRIGEALGLDRADAPAADGALRSLMITGKGNKQRVVPVLPVVAEAIADYLAACPHDLGPGDPLFVGVRGKRLQPRLIQHTMAGLRGALGPAGVCDAARAPPQLRHAPARGRRRSAHDPGAARAREPLHHAALHRDRRGRASRRLQGGAPARRIAAPAPTRANGLAGAATDTQAAFAASSDST